MAGHEQQIRAVTAGGSLPGYIWRRLGRVAAGILGGVEGGIGSLDDFLNRAGVRRVGHAETDRCAKPEPSSR